MIQFVNPGVSQFVLSGSLALAAGRRTSVALVRFCLFKTLQFLCSDEVAAVGVSGSVCV